MEIVIEILREAGIHFPTPIGQTLGVVGGIILGQAAISSKIVSPLLLMVIGITVICTFVIPTYNFSMAVRLLRFPMVILTAMFGAFGLSIGWVLLLVHLVKLESFGVPYLAPFAPIRFTDFILILISLGCASGCWDSSDLNTKNTPIVGAYDLSAQSDKEQYGNKVDLIAIMPLFDREAKNKYFVDFTTGTDVIDNRNKKQYHLSNSYQTGTGQCLLFGVELAGSKDFIGALEVSLRNPNFLVKIKK
jgi:hypothetical protein